MTKPLSAHVSGLRPRVALVLGSGMSDLAARLTGARPIPYAEIEGAPPAVVQGHEGALYAGEVAGVPALLFAGRAHLYEGHDAAKVTALVRDAIGCGAGVVVLTNAAGAVNPRLQVGAPHLISDHLNLTGTSPLLGGPHFIDMTDAYDSELRALAASVDPDLSAGVYAGLVGPSYETAAEVRMLAAMGAEMVGMSTVLETIQARALGARVLGISLVTNLAAGLTAEPVSHEEVQATARSAAGRLEALLRGVIRAL